MTTLHSLHDHAGRHSISPADLNMLSLVSSTDSLFFPTNNTNGNAARERNRRPPVDPLMIAVATSSTADLTRNHYLHEFFPHTLAYTSCDDEAASSTPPRNSPHGKSRQGPRSVRLAQERQGGLQLSTGTIEEEHDDIEIQVVINNDGTSEELIIPKPTLLSPSDHPPKARRPSFSDPAVAKLIRHRPSAAIAALHASTESVPALEIKCHVRTRIPTPHGHIFLHLYKNNHDDKEHLAFVADQAQMDAHPGEAGPSSMPFIRSATLDGEWRVGETDIERIVRGAYLGRLSSEGENVSSPVMTTRPLPNLAAGEDHPVPPLVRIHSECFTGETIGSQRCDCGEQLDEAFRLITEARRGVVVYLRQEGRGIGLLEKMRAYNLQDLGHDTVAANLLLGHGADLRTYDIAGAILRDLAIPEVRLLTNNPDKIQKIEKEGVTVVERVEMVPRSWAAPGNTTIPKKKRRPILSGAALLALAAESLPIPRGPDGDAIDEDEDDEEDEDDVESMDSDAAHYLRRSGVGMIGGSTTRSAELDKYLKTKIERMGHLLSLPATPLTPPSSRSETPARRGSLPSSTITSPQLPARHLLPAHHQHSPLDHST